MTNHFWVAYATTLIAITCVGNVASGDDHLGPFDAAVTHKNQKAYFFKGGNYLRFDYDIDRFDKIGRTGRSGWAGVWTDGIDAAVEHPLRNALFFFKGDRYQRFDFDKNKVDKDATINEDGWYGVWRNVDAALVHPNRKKAYFFKGDRYQRFDFNSDKIDADKANERIGVDGWHGVWTDGIDAAITHRNEHVYFFKGDRYRRYDFKEDRVDKEGTIGVDGWKFMEDYAILPAVGKTSTVSLQSWLGTFVSVKRGNIVVANSAQVGDAEVFEMKRIDEGHVSLKSNTGKYLSAQNGGGTVVLANRDNPDDSAKFQLQMDGSGLFAFAASDGHCLRTDKSGILIADRRDAAESEMFRLVHPAVANGDVTPIEVNVYKIVTSPAYHTGTVFDRTEYFFSSNGQVETCDPKGMPTSGVLKFIHHRTMGRLVPGNKKAVNALRDRVIARWNGTRYDLGSHNCNVFTNDLLHTLGVAGIDQEYLDGSGFEKGLRQIPGASTTSELLVVWPIKDKRLDEAFMDDLIKMANLPRDTVKELERFGGRVQDAVNDAHEGVQKIVENILNP